MNIEKVLDIAVQADPTTVEVLGEVGGRAFIATNGIRPQYIQKFAELIVKECAELVKDFTLEQEVALDQYDEYEASAVLKQHFGIEE